MHYGEQREKDKDSNAKPTQYIAFGDLETGGLNGYLSNGKLGMQSLPILEIAFIVTDINLNQVGKSLHIIIHHSDRVLANMDEWAINTHQKSGLLDAVRQSDISIQQAQRMVIDYLKELGIEKYDRKTKAGAVFAGNSIMFDRSYIMCQMPILHDYMHYRQLDVSALALAFRFFNPEVEAQINKEYKHEALSDIQETIEELRLYKKYITLHNSKDAASGRSGQGYEREVLGQNNEGYTLTV